MTTAEYMTWDVTDLGFRMGLSPRVPAVLARHVAGVVDEMLAAHGLGRADVDSLGGAPGRTADPRGRAAPARSRRGPRWTTRTGCSRDHGNCSSATVLLVLERMRAAGIVAPGRHLVALAFGPGLTLYATLLRAT